MSEVAKEFISPGEPCDLVIVRADNASHVVEVRRDIAKMGDRVDFLMNREGLVCGFVEDILHCNCMDDTYCFIGAVAQIHKPSGVYNRVWASRQLLESLEA